jgi:hypothetical protein
MVGSKERTEGEWRELLSHVGLKVTEIYGRDLSHAVIEAVKV